jgi:hypothetical protein
MQKVQPASSVVLPGELRTCPLISIGAFLHIDVYAEFIAKQCMING